MQSIVSFVHVQLRWLPVRRLPEWLVCMTPVFLQIEECHNCKSEKCQKAHSSHLSHGRTWKKHWCSDVTGKTWQDMMSHTMIRDVVRIWRLILRVRQGRNGRTMSDCLALFSRQVQKEKEKERKFKESCVAMVPFSIIFHATWQVTKEAVRNLMHLWQHSGRSLAWQLNQLNLRTKKQRDITRFDSGGAASMCIMESHVWSLRSFFLLCKHFCSKSNVQYIIDYNSIYVIYVYIRYAAANLLHCALW